MQRNLTQSKQCRHWQTEPGTLHASVWGVQGVQGCSVKPLPRTHLEHVKEEFVASLDLLTAGWCESLTPTVPTSTGPFRLICMNFPHRSGLPLGQVTSGCIFLRSLARNFNSEDANAPARVEIATMWKKQNYLINWLFAHYKFIPIDWIYKAPIYGDIFECCFIKRWDDEQLTLLHQFRWNIANYSFGLKPFLCPVAHQNDLHIQEWFWHLNTQAIPKEKQSSPFFFMFCFAHYRFLMIFRGVC